MVVEVFMNIGCLFITYHMFPECCLEKLKKGPTTLQVGYILDDMHFKINGYKKLIPFFFLSFFNLLLIDCFG